MFIKTLADIGDDILIGYGYRSDIMLNGTGEAIYPCIKACVVNAEGEVEKTYEREAIYILAAEENNNLIKLSRAKKVFNGMGYEEVEEDYLINYISSKKEAVSITSRTTEHMFREYYVKLPSSFRMSVVPSETKAKETILTNDVIRTVIPEEDTKNYFLVYSFGDIIGSYSESSDAIKKADLLKNVGTVVDKKGRIVWERGIKFTSYYLPNYSGTLPERGLTNRQAVCSYMLSYMGINDYDASELTAELGSQAFLQKNIGGDNVITLRGVELDEALYFVYKGSVLYAMRSLTDPIAIVGYNYNTITYFDPMDYQFKTMTLEEAKGLFSYYGNIYLTYIR